MSAQADQRHLRQAIELARQNVQQGAGGPFGCVVVRDGEPIAEGCNAVSASLDPTAHAEIVAIRRACRALGSFQLEGCVVYSSCEPCPMCMGAILWARPERVVFAAGRADAAAAGFDDARLYVELQKPLAERTTPVQQQLRDEGLSPFEAWARSPDRIDY